MNVASLRTILSGFLLIGGLLGGAVARGDAPAPSNADNKVSSRGASSGVVQGRVLGPEGSPAVGVLVSLTGQGSALTDEHGEFRFASVPTGLHELIVEGTGFHTARMNGVLVATNRTLTLETVTLQPAEEVVRLDRYVLQGERKRLGAVARGEALLTPRTAGGNLDLPRTEDGALPFRIYNREQIERSGVINLNALLQRELLDSDATTRPPEQSGMAGAFATGSANMNLRGFGSDSTVLLLNGRRMPESPPAPGSSELGSPDMNFIPLSLVQQVEVLPVSASALYSGNAIGGVVNIILRPDLDTTEVTTTYTEALDGFSAPQSILSLQHGRVLLGGRFRLRLNANFARATPPTKSDLGYSKPSGTTNVAQRDAVYGATPNVRSITGAPLFSSSGATVTSVAPGANGTGGIQAFSGREGVRNTGLFAPAGAQYVAYPGSLYYPFGRHEKRDACLASLTYDVLPSLQLGLDLTFARTVVKRGYDAFTADLELRRELPTNPFGQHVQVSVAEIAPELGEFYSQAKVDFSAAVLAALVRLPAEWRLGFDGQVTRGVTRFRGLVGADRQRWQQLVNEGVYNPLRDTQVFAPPPEFYEQVLVYRGGRNQFVRLSDYQTFDGAVRLTNQALRLPTGRGTIAVGSDFRSNKLAPHTDRSVFADGTDAENPVAWTGRSLTRYSFFGELQAPLLPARWLPAWLRGIETDLGARYVASDNQGEANLAPAGAVRIDFAHGFALRGSVATANRVPTPYMGNLKSLGDDVRAAGPIELVTIYDSVRGERYPVESQDAPNYSLKPESAVTRSYGLVYETGQVHRIRTMVDYVTTEKSLEQIYLSAQAAADLQSMWPGRIEREDPDGSQPVGRITHITTGTVNVAWRRSASWNLAVDYTWTGFLKGTLEAYGRWVGYQSYKRQVMPNTATVDQLETPDGTACGLLRHRSTFGADWSNDRVRFGVDGRYYGSRALPDTERAVQGGDSVSPFWQYDLYSQWELRRWLSWFKQVRGLRLLVRVDNILDSKYPRYANDPSGAGVQAYGDWRGRTYSVAVTTSF